MSDEALFVGDRFYRSQFQNGISSYLVFLQNGLFYADPLFPGGVPYSGLDGAAVTHSAANALPSGGSVQIKDSFTAGSQMVIPDGVKVCGLGWNKTVITAQNNLNADMFKVTGSNVIFEDLSLVGNKANQ